MERLKPRVFFLWPLASVAAAVAFSICLSGLRGLPDIDSATIVYVGNAVLVLAVSAMFGFVATRVQGTFFAGALVAAVLLVSPFARSVLVNPVSGESLLGLLGLGFLLADVLGAVRLPNIIAVVLPAAAAALAPEYSCAIIVCIIGHFGRDRKNEGLVALALTCCVVAAYVVSVLHRTNGAAAMASGSSFTITMVSLGIACFLLGPLILLGIRVASRFGSVRPRRSFFAVAVGLFAMLGGFIVPTDPSAAIFAAEACGLVGIAVASMNEMVVAVALVALGVGNLFALRPLANELPAVAQWREETALSAAIIRSSAQHGCIASGNNVDVLSHLEGAARVAAARWTIKSSAVDCMESSPDALISIDHDDIRAWEAGTVALAHNQLLHGASQAETLATAKATLNPKLGHPGGFPISVQTPLGTADGFTITAGYAYDVPCAATVRTAHLLTFAAYDPLHDYPHADPVRLTVAIDDRVVFSRVFRPSDPNASDWRMYRATLPAVDHCRVVRFTAAAPSGSAVASWVSVAAPTLYF